MNRMNRGLAVSALLTASLLVPAGCRKEVDESRTGPPQTSTTTQNVQAVPDRSRQLPGQPIANGAAAEYQVDLLEYAIHVPATIPAGARTLRISNAGKETHGLVVEGNGTQVQVPNRLSRGDTTALMVDLKPGTYTIWCPVDGHRGKGMSATFAVQ
jgi:plastocyanin